KVPTNTTGVIIVEEFGVAHINCAAEGESTKEIIELIIMTLLKIKLQQRLCVRRKLLKKLIREIIMVFRLGKNRKSRPYGSRKGLGLRPNSETSVGRVRSLVSLLNTHEDVAALLGISSEGTPYYHPFMEIVTMTGSLDKDHTPFSQLIPMRVRFCLGKAGSKPMAIPKYEYDYPAY
ncbi:hypothetical protein HAX54_020276, partial [Datura stramonium]|nr:hypothetical protein [Datura stramonium]